MITELCLTFLLFFLTVWFINLNVQRRKLKDLKSGKYFPGPFHLPLIGCLIPFALLKFKFQKLRHSERLHGICQIYGKTCKGWMVELSTLITEDFEVAKEILNSPDFISRTPSHPRFQELTFCKNLGLMMSRGENWKEMRRFTVKGMKNFGFGELKSSEIEVDEELEYFIKKMEKDRLSNERNEIYMHCYFQIPLFNTIWKSMSGTRFDYDDPDIIRLVKAVEQASGMEIGFDIEWVFNCLRYVPGFSHCWNKCKSCLIVHEYFRKVMAERRAAGTYKTTPTNFIDYFLKAIDDEIANKHTLFTDEQFIATCSDLLYGGVDTTAVATDFAMLYLAKHPSIQKRAQDEIDCVIGKQRRPNYSQDAKNMPFVKALMLEIFRHGNVLAFACRTSSCDTEVKGHFVEADVFAGINLLIIHRDPNIWGSDADEFRPERFLNDKLEIVNEDKLLAFGSGKRMCIGYTMAKLMWFKYITTILQKYNIERSPIHPKLDETDTIQGITNNPKPFYIVVKPRSTIHQNM